MSFRLEKAVFKVRCREPGCPFLSEFVVKENLMGVTEADIDSEALKIAKNLAFIKHDAIYGRKHQLVNPEIFKTGSSYERIGGLMAGRAFAPESAGGEHGNTRSFRRGEIVARKREEAAVACEVVRGSAINAGHPDMRYKAGSVFGTAALFGQRSRPVDIVAAEDGTEVAFHNVKELTKTYPARARDLYDAALQDVFAMFVHFGDYAASLEKKIEKLQSQKGARKAAAGRAGAKPAARSAAAARGRSKPARKGAAPRGKAGRKR